jgi:pSer/pThr/pTyr-binding forkhead associated (FHA) protein
VPLRLQVTALNDPQARVFRYEFDADRAQILLGRRGGVDVLLPNAKVSLVHARIERHAGVYTLSDDGSTNGTRLNGAAVPAGQRRTLKDGDRIAIGAYLLQVGISEQKVDWPTEASSSLARHMAREVLERLGPGESQPSLLVLDGPQTGMVLTLGEPGRTFVLGRAGRGDLRLDDVDMWRERAALVRDAEGVTVRELAPGTPLTVNGERVGGARLLRDGDVLVFGGTSLRYLDPADVYLRKLEAGPDERAAESARIVVRAPVRERRPELVLLAIGASVALIAAGALVYVLLW